MNTNKIIPRKVQSQHGIELLPLFRERIGQAGEPAHLHSHGQVLPFDMGSADLAHIGVAEDRNLFASDAFGGRVPYLCLGRSGIQLDQLCELDALHAKAHHNSILVGFESVRGDLKAAFSSRSQLFRKGYRIAFAKPSKVPSQNQFAVPFDCDERPGVADSDIVTAFADLGFFFHSDVSPKLIALHFFDSQPVDALVHQSLTANASEGEKIQNGSRVDSGYSGSAADAATLHQVLQNAHSLFFGQDHIAERFWLYLYERLAALRAAIPLLILAGLPKLLGWYVAGWAVHGVSSREQHKIIKHSKHCQEKSALIREKSVFPPKINFPYWEFEGSYVESCFEEENRAMTVGLGLICESGDCVILCSDIRSRSRTVSVPHDWTGKQYPFPPYDIAATIAGDTSSTHAIVSEFSAWLSALIKHKQNNKDFEIYFEHIRAALEKSRKKELRRLQICALSASIGVEVNDWIAGKLSDGRNINNYLQIQGLQVIREVGEGMWKKAQIIVGGFIRHKPFLLRGVGKRAAEDGPTPALFVIGGIGAKNAQEVLHRRGQSSEMGIARSLFHAYEAMAEAKKHDQSVGKMDSFVVIRKRGISGRGGISRFKWNHPILKTWAKQYKRKTTRGLERYEIDEMIREGLDPAIHPNSEWLGTREMAGKL